MRVRLGHSPEIADNFLPTRQERTGHLVLFWVPHCWWVIFAGRFQNRSCRSMRVAGASFSIVGRATVASCLGQFHQSTATHIALHHSFIHPIATAMGLGRKLLGRLLAGGRSCIGGEIRRGRNLGKTAMW